MVNIATQLQIEFLYILWLNVFKMRIKSLLIAHLIQINEYIVKNLQIQPNVIGCLDAGRW